jgi:hypothetical protein
MGGLFLPLDVAISGELLLMVDLYMEGEAIG